MTASTLTIPLAMFHNILNNKVQYQILWEYKESHHFVFAIMFLQLPLQWSFPGLEK